MNNIAAIASRLLCLLCLLAGHTVTQAAGAQLTLSAIPGWNLLSNSGAVAMDVPTTLGDTSQVFTVWKWNATTGRWAFYAPSMSSTDLAAYAQQKGYEVLATIAPKEGFWVNALTQTALSGSTGNGVMLFASDLLAGWNLVGSADLKTPSLLNQDLSTTLTASGKTMLTLWAWDAPNGKWRFYAPSLEAQGGTVLNDYIAGKFYLPFTTALSATDGFWVNIEQSATTVVPVTYMPGTTCPVDSNLQCSQWIANGAACTYQSCTCYFNTPGVGADDSGFWTTKTAPGDITRIFDCKLDAGLSSQQIADGSCSILFSPKVKSFIDSCNPTCTNGATDYPVCTPPAITITSATCVTEGGFQTVKVTGTASLATGTQLKNDSSMDVFLGLKCASWPFICRRESGEPATSTWTAEGGVNVADGVTLSFGVRTSTGTDSLSSTVTCHR